MTTSRRPRRQTARLSRLLRQQRNAAPSVPEVRYGTVAAVTGSRLTITLGAGTVDVVDVPRLASYSSPTVGDKVLVLRHDDDLVVLGEIA